MKFSNLALIALALTGSACEDTTETIDNFDSRVACEDYCEKKNDCSDAASNSDTDACVSACRNSIEDNCGNENQAAANDKIGECVDKGCAAFGVCMTFEVAPECFGFVEGS